MHMFHNADLLQMTKTRFLPSCVVTTMTNLSSTSLKSRRNRTSFTRYQLEELERVFTQAHYPDANIRQVMSEKLDLAEAKIQVKSPPCYAYIAYFFRQWELLDYSTGR